MLANVFFCLVCLSVCLPFRLRVFILLFCILVFNLFGVAFFDFVCVFRLLFWGRVSLGCRSSWPLCADCLQFHFLLFVF